MDTRSFLFLVVSCLGLALPGHSSAGCSIGKMADIPVTMRGLRALVPVKFNGADATLAVDSGAFYSLLAPASAAEYHLKVGPTPVIRMIRGVNGYASVGLTTINDFSIANIPIPHLQFLVGGTEVGAGAAGLLGQNVLGIGDVEYDFANGALRLMKPVGCDSNSVLAYWAQASAIPYGVIELEEYGLVRHTIGTIYINGVKIRAIFDTGAPTSILKLSAAKRAGVTPDSPGVVAAGYSTGVGTRGEQNWIGNFASVKLGTEEVKNTRLRFGEIELQDSDMLIGADFFLSHHIYVANGQHRLYFTYNGGPVFNLAAPPPSTAASSGLSAVPPLMKESESDPSDADGFSRRGSAFEARRDFEHALADFSRAIELDSSDSKYFFQRSQAYWLTKQPELAVKDLDQAIKLKPDFVDALVARAQAHLAAGDKSTVQSDLDAADRIAPPEAPIRMALGTLYERVDLLDAASKQYDLWIKSHQNDAYLPVALNEACWVRALSGQELKQALDDCDHALRLRSNFWAALNSRAWVEFRLGRFKQSISDFDSDLRNNPKSASSLYGKGLDELRLGDQKGGSSDISAAAAIDPLIKVTSDKYGLSP
jgi:tetratricopeptide (TPR) repeat protein